MIATSITLNRRRRLAAAVLALPLSLAMTGSALATGSTIEPPTSGSATAESRAAVAAPAGTGGSPSGNAAAHAAARSTAAADKAAADKAAADKAAADKAAADTTTAQAPAAAKAAKPTAPGAAAGSAAGTASTGGTYVNGNANSSKAERPTAPVPGTPSQPLSKADKNGTGANPGTSCTHNYCSNGTGLPTGNGVGNGKAAGQPCAGCVGKADNKNPKGQAPSGPVDRNAGYECDRNQGIGQTNPAHTGCTSGTASPAATQPAKKPTPPPSTPPKSPQNPGKGTAVMTIAVDCRTITVTSTKDISNIAVFFVDGTSIKIDGLSGKTVTRTFGKDIVRATSKSATTTVGAPATGCGVLPTSGPTPPAQTCPDGSPMPAGGKKDCLSGTTPGQPATGGDKITICHATGSPTNPYVVITIDRNGLNGHGDHAGDIIPMPAGGCPAPGATAPADACPNMAGVQASGTPCNIGGGNGGGGAVELCPNGEVMRDGNPANCPTAPPVCPTVMPVTGPVQAGCQPQVPPTQGGGGTVPPTGSIPIGTVTPGQPAVNPPGQNPPGQNPPGQTPPLGSLPIGTVTPGQPAAIPVPVGPPTGIRPNGTTPQIISGLPTSPARGRAVPSALPFTGTDAALLAELGALLLLAGGGITVAARRERAARAA